MSAVKKHSSSTLSSKSFNKPPIPVPRNLRRTTVDLVEGLRKNEFDEIHELQEINDKLEEKDVSHENLYCNTNEQHQSFITPYEEVKPPSQKSVTPVDLNNNELEDPQNSYNLANSVDNDKYRDIDAGDKIESQNIYCLESFVVNQDVFCVKNDVDGFPCNRDDEESNLYQNSSFLLKTRRESDVSVYYKSAEAGVELYDCFKNEPFYQVYYENSILRSLIPSAYCSDEDEDEDNKNINSTNDNKDHNRNTSKSSSINRSGTLKQTSFDKSSLSSSSPPSSLTHRYISAVSFANFLTTVGKRKLWSETERVKKELSTAPLPKQERRYQECLFEILTSEASYFKSLHIFQSHFLSSPHLDPSSATLVINKPSLHHLISNISSIIDASYEMLSTLNNLWKANYMLDGSLMCQALIKVAEKHSDTYINYISNSYYQLKMLDYLIMDPTIQSSIQSLESDPKVEGLKFQSFLLAPVQRVTRMPLLIENVIEKYPEGSENVPKEITDCLKMFLDIAHKSNERTKKLQNIEIMANIHKLLRFKQNMKTIPLMSSDRYLIKRGSLLRIKFNLKAYNNIDEDDNSADSINNEKINKNKKNAKKISLKQSLNKIRSLFQTQYKDVRIMELFMFNDLLIIAQKDGSMYNVVTHCPNHHIYSDTINDYNTPTSSPSSSSSFFLTTSSSSSSSAVNTPVSMKYLFYIHIQSIEEPFVFSCNAENERMRWIQVLSNDAGKQNNALKSENCLHVCAISSHPARQMDELEVQVGDFLNVHTSLADGWCEGERIRDGRRGWFRGECVGVVEDEQVRKRNQQKRERFIRYSNKYVAD